jgi:dienelactone hydrolase
MAEVVLFHHVQGLTPGVVAFADILRDAGHTVHAPDLFEGRTFSSIEDGMEYVAGIGSGEVLTRAVRATGALPAEVVYGGFSLGVVAAQNLAQTRPGARGALLFYSCVPVSAFGEAWPEEVPVQVHAMDADPFFNEEGGDIDAARELVDQVKDAELFLYPGDQHLFADSSLPSYDADAAALLTERTLAFLNARLCHNNSGACVLVALSRPRTRDDRPGVAFEEAAADDAEADTCWPYVHTAITLTWRPGNIDQPCLSHEQNPPDGARRPRSQEEGPARMG